ncbi:hypothetical protein [Streptomyces sp. NPDC090798]|uniref:hypothetical protein n=1 Tax=Streptomyces sp. NPDC090798 TaxID=3365968 RepID=UPI0037F58DAE
MAAKAEHAVGLVEVDAWALGGEQVGRVGDEVGGLLGDGCAVPAGHEGHADAGESGLGLVVHGGDADVGAVLKVDRVGVGPFSDVLTEWRG